MKRPRVESCCFQRAVAPVIALIRRAYGKRVVAKLRSRRPLLPGGRCSSAPLRVAALLPLLPPLLSLLAFRRQLRFLLRRQNVVHLREHARVCDFEFELDGGTRLPG